MPIMAPSISVVEGARLKVIAEVTNKTIPAGSTDVTVIDPTDVSGYKFKTITFKVDYAFPFKLQVSDDGTTWDDLVTNSDVVGYSADKLIVLSTEEDFLYMRLLMSNPDTADHTVNYARIKGRAL